MEQGDLLSPNEACEALGISRPTFYRWLKDGIVEAVRVGKRLRVSRMKVEDLLRSGGEAKARQWAAVAQALEMFPGGSPSKRRSKQKEAHPMPTETMDRGETLAMKVLAHAAESHASVVQIEPSAGGITVRERVEGALTTVASALPSDAIAPLASAFRKMAGAEADAGRPSDRQFVTRLGGRDITVRASTFPTTFGESVTLRLLDPQAVLLDGERLGFPKGVWPAALDLVSYPKGVLVVNGPSGSGKTTTLYCLLAQLRRPDLKVMTAEDPVEFCLEGVQQGAVGPEMSFLQALRAMLRSDLDIGMVSEIRDAETLSFLFTAAHAGHLLLTALHCEDGLQAIQRMVHLGVSPDRIAEDLLGVLSQRLVRKLCPHCKASVRLTREEARHLGLDSGKVWKGAKGKGCPKCGGTGLKGRTAVAELLPIGPSMRRALLSDSSPAGLAAGLPEGFRPLRADLADRVIAGEVSPSEAAMVLAPPEE